MHEGHRQRMYEKLENSGDNLFDHELLEILLFSACPRVNTNPIAHALLDRFVTLSGVFNASVEELKEVDGVGENTARFLKIVGLCSERAEKSAGAPALKNLGDCKRFIDVRFRGKTEEYVELYFLSKNGRVQRIFNFTSSEKSRAAAEIDSVARNIALYRPCGIIIAHNHVDGTIEPSQYDDNFTHAVQFLGNMNGAEVLDHLIYCSREKVFSYKDSGRLDKVKDYCSWETFEKWIKTLN